MKQKKREVQGGFERKQWLFFWKEEERHFQQRQSQKQRCGGVKCVWETAHSEVPWFEHGVGGGMVPETWL